MSFKALRSISIAHPLLNRDFLDDYAVDPLERNDQSFLFVVETDNHTIARLKLYPTVIRDMQANKAAGGEDKRLPST